MSEKKRPDPFAALPFLRDEKRTKEDERLQEIRSASFTRSKLTEQERLIARGLSIIEIATANLQTMEEGRKRRGKGRATIRMVNEEKSRLAEGLAMVGRYEAAAKVHPAKKMAKEYQAVAEAIERDDVDECTCKAETTTINGQEVELPRTNILRRIYSEPHGGMVELEGCKCGKFMNARKATGVLAAAVALSRANHAAVVANREAVAAGRQPMARLISDGGVLRR